jgi:hypothetical protein
VSLNLQTRSGYEVDVVRVDDSTLRMTVLVTNPDGKASGRHIFNIQTMPGADPAQVCREAYPIAFEEAFS